MRRRAALPAVQRERLPASVLAHFSHVETGVRRATLCDVRDLCQIYGVDSQTSAKLMELARQARQPGWWTKYDDLKIAPYIGMQQAVTAITAFGMYYVPALLQSEEYARAIIKGIAPKIDEGIIGQRVEARSIRQKLLSQTRPPKYRAGRRGSRAPPGGRLRGDEGPAGQDSLAHAGGKGRCSGDSVRGGRLRSS